MLVSSFGYMYVRVKQRSQEKMCRVNVSEKMIRSLSKIEKVPRGIRGEKSSKDMASSKNLFSTIGALASPKIRDGTRCPEG